MKVRAFSIFNEDPFNIGLEILCIRQLQSAATDAASTASKVGANLGNQAAQEGAQLNPFYSREMHAEHAYDPTQLNEMLTAAGAGTGAAVGAADTQMQRTAATTGNAAGVVKSEQELARDRMKTNAGVSEGIAGQDVQGALALRQQGAAGEQGLYGENLKGQLDAMGQVSGDINAATNASKTGWLQNAEGVVNTAANVAGAGAAVKNAGGMF
jgi:hypothetical protein